MVQNMAYYGDKTKVLQTTDANKTAKYSKVWKPGQNPDFAGIYKCQICNYEDVINRECTSLPPCSNCGGKPMEWKLLVRATD